MGLGIVERSDVIDGMDGQRVDALDTKKGAEEFLSRFMKINSYEDFKKIDESDFGNIVISLATIVDVGRGGIQSLSYGIGGEGTVGIIFKYPQDKNNWTVFDFNTQKMSTMPKEVGPTIL